MRDLLASRGYCVVHRYDADEAWPAIRAQHPDLVLLDVIMPGRSGYELCRETEGKSGYPAHPDRHDHRTERPR